MKKIKNIIKDIHFEYRVLTELYEIKPIFLIIIVLFSIIFIFSNIMIFIELIQKYWR